MCSFIIEVSSREVQRLCPVSSACVQCSGHSPDLRHRRLAARVRVSGSKSNFFFLDGVFEKGVKEICYSGFAEHVKRGRRGSQDEDPSFEDGSGGGESPLQRAISPPGPPHHQMDHIHPRLSRAHGDSKYSPLVANYFLILVLVFNLCRAPVFLHAVLNRLLSAQFVCAQFLCAQFEPISWEVRMNQMRRPC